MIWRPICSEIRNESWHQASINVLVELRFSCKTRNHRKRKTRFCASKPRKTIASSEVNCSHWRYFFFRVQIKSLYQICLVPQTWAEIGFLWAFFLLTVRLNAFFELRCVPSFLSEYDLECVHSVEKSPSPGVIFSIPTISPCVLSPLPGVLSTWDYSAELNRSFLPTSWELALFSSPTPSG